MNRLFVVLIAYITVTFAFTLRINSAESRPKRCIVGPDGECIIVRPHPPKCDHPNCINGGCVGWTGVCAGICYCYGSGYEHRCTLPCDVVG